MPAEFDKRRTRIGHVGAFKKMVSQKKLGAMESGTKTVIKRGVSYRTGHARSKNKFQVQRDWRICSYVKWNTSYLLPFLLLNFPALLPRSGPARAALPFPPLAYLTAFRVFKTPSSFSDLDFLAARSMLERIANEAPRSSPARSFGAN